MLFILHCFLTENGKLYTFGSNDWGQLGHGNRVQFPSPKLVKRKRNSRYFILNYTPLWLLVITLLSKRKRAFDC